MKLIKQPLKYLHQLSGTVKEVLIKKGEKAKVGQVILKVEVAAVEKEVKKAEPAKEEKVATKRN